MRGSCLCGGVVFEVAGPSRPVVTCHCTQCRKQSGHFWAASAVPQAAMIFAKSDTLAWYAASTTAKRGFCTGCGAFLFWQEAGSDQISFAPGAIDGPTGLQIGQELHVEDAGDYYHGPMTEAAVLQGSCLCGANRFTVPRPMGEVWGCHCNQCRKTSGHFSASFDVDYDKIVWLARDTRDHVSPGGGVRSFCPTCGCGILFHGPTETSVEAGVIDNPTGGRLVRHIFVASKGDYYDLTDGLPQD
jgi:hypothetical protein